MRLTHLLFALAFAGCGHDEEVRAIGLVVTPSAAMVDTAGSVQLMAAVTWSDGAQHPADVTFSTIGGIITSTGLYRAGTAAGDYRVIASCDCGLVDTVVIRIAEPPTRQRFATLVIAVSGLPSGVPAQVNVTGRGGYTRATTASVTLDSLPPDDYVIQATEVATDSGNYSPAPDSQSTSLAAGENKSVQVTYTRAAPTGLPPHPRVWMTPARIAHLKVQAAANTDRWQRVKAGADAQLARGVTYQWQDAQLLPEVCATYLGTGDARYATRAGVILSRFAVDGADLTNDSGYDYRFWLPVVTMGLDWCYNGLTVGQRHQVATWLMNRADWVWPETNPSRANAWGLWASSNYYWGFMQTGPAALAAAGDDTLPGNRPGRHRQLALTKWTGMAVPYLATGGAGGAWGEGTNYDSSWFVARFVDAFLTAGIPLSDPFLGASLHWHLAATMPGFRFKAPLGDQPRESTAPLYSYDRVAVLDMLAAAHPDATLTAQVQFWLNQIGQVPTTEFNSTATLTEELLHFDPVQPAATDLGALPLTYLAAGAGYFIARRSWTDPRATVLVFESGPVGGHAALDANGLKIWKGSFWVSADANISSASGIAQATQNYNNLTVGGAGQTVFDGNTGRIVGTQVSDALVVVRGQAKDAYGYPPGTSSGRSVVSDYLRTVAYLPAEDAIIVVDRATVVDPAQEKVWRWHSSGVPVISGNTFTLSNPAGDQRCVGTVLLPGDAVLGTQSFALGSGGAVSSHAVTVTLPTGRASDVVVTVLQCTNALAAPFTPTATTTPLATDVLIGSTHIVVPLDETQAVRIE